MFTSFRFTCSRFSHVHYHLVSNISAFHRNGRRADFPFELFAYRQKRTGFSNDRFTLLENEREARTLSFYALSDRKQILYRLDSTSITRATSVIENDPGSMITAKRGCSSHTGWQNQGERFELPLGVHFDGQTRNCYGDHNVSKESQKSRKRLPRRVQRVSWDDSLGYACPYERVALIYH